MKRLFSLIIFISILTACSEPVNQLNPLDDEAIILAFGDSLTYGTGANDQSESYPAVLEDLTGIEVINAGIPGETSKEGLERLPSLLSKYRPDLVIICHGGNDFLRRLNKNKLKSNLQQMVDLVTSSGSQTMLIAVPTLGFGLKPEQLYTELAQENALAIERDSLAELEGRAELKSDQVHLNTEGYSILADRVFTLLLEANAIEMN